MSDLGPDDFERYFVAVHDTPPFPWQSRLLREVARSGSWPSLLDLPTGTGKTSALDVALFHLALEAGRAERHAPLRIVYVVDRRIIVSQAAERARKIRNALRAPKDPVLQQVAAQLRGLRDGEPAVAGGPARISKAGRNLDEPPLRVTELRGGIARDDAWARSPCEPLLAVSTVDQIGSRLLFRGYGVSDRMAPIHAGLLGQDCLLLLDEVHLSQPFKQTLASIAAYRRWPDQDERSAEPWRRRWAYVQMSATAGRSEDAFTLDTADRRHPVLRQRVEAAKPTRLVDVKVSGEEPAREAALAQALARAAESHVAPGRVVAVVVNRVRTARSVHERLREALGGRADLLLLTGRMRPLDRDRIERADGKRMAAGRPVDPGARPLVVVSTQCIEAGADYDFDALVTECASLDALRQRFGRLNRRGERGGVGAVLCRADVKAGHVDPIYGAALAETWRWLKGREPLDFGAQALQAEIEKLTPDELSKLMAKAPDAPVLLPAHLDAWAQTAPRPAIEPEVALWLHGPDRQPAEVQIIWRADLTEELLRAADPKVTGAAAVEAKDAIQARLEACPPASSESLSVPLHAVRRWLSSESGAADFGDVEGSAEGEEVGGGGDRLAWRWRGEASELVGPGEILPGDTLVVPAAYGGLEHDNWAPEATEAVIDLGDLAQRVQRGRPMLRLLPKTLARLLPGEELPAPPRPTDETDQPGPRAALSSMDDAAGPLDPWPALRGWLSQLAERTSEISVQELLEDVKRSKGRRLNRMLVIVPGLSGDAEYFALLGHRRKRNEETSAALLEDGGATTEDDAAASLTGVPVPLREHMVGVAVLAREFASRCGIPADLQRDLELAARWHDAGKADPRFQALLHGSELRAEASGVLLAKSAIHHRDHERERQAWQRSGYPRGARHELMSVALLQGQDELQGQARSWDLVLHLVAAHHGHCRPLAPLAPDPSPVSVSLRDGGLSLSGQSDHGLERLDSGICDRFFSLQRRYGWYGLAYLEAILRLADHRRSEDEQRAAGEDEMPERVGTTTEEEQP